MGKKQKQNHNQEHQIELDIEDEKSQTFEAKTKPLHKFLPYHKYIPLRNKIYKKKLSKAVKGIELNKMQIKKAVECLTKYAQEHRDPTDLTEKQDYIYINVEVSRIPEQHSVRPIQIKLPHPIYSAEARTRYTVITSDQNLDDFIANVEQLNTPMLQDVIGYSQVRKEFKALKDKRELLAANDLFFCDWKVYNLLRQPLGKLFYEAKKYPYPIDCDGQVPEHLKQEYPTYESYINGLANNTYTMLGNGPSYSLKVCKTKQQTRQQVKNIMHGSLSLIANLLEKNLDPTHIRQISIKTYNSPSLPIYCHLTKEEISSLKV